MEACKDGWIKAIPCMPLGQSLAHSCHPIHFYWNIQDKSGLVVEVERSQAAFFLFFKGRREIRIRGWVLRTSLVAWWWNSQPLFLGLASGIKDTMDLCVTEILRSVHPATWPCKDSGRSHLRKLSLWVRSEWLSSWFQMLRWSKSSRAGSGSSGWSQQRVFLWTWDLYSCCPLLGG